MVNLEIQNYITQARAQGLTDNQIRKNLAGKGWRRNEIDIAFGKKHYVFLIIICLYLICGFYLLYLLGNGYWNDYKLISGITGIDEDSLGWEIVIVSFFSTIYGFIGLILAFASKALKSYSLIKILLIILSLILLTSFLWGRGLESYLESST